ncbi:alpha/beta fold hydrolase [Dactylococcopsis salina]|uniref:Hydrolase or acyltransferase of alpha/beta superfamily n=1 Tax=Dactylococcopsis salina (strain PCC 8305) TaxID=13035 RepID=K9YTM8_DACS8|nr:alpha/beta fold hydrolase [Dactylococcopsis salina]AFZ49690.1 putative hydrolase or acyltransferase of alpha/beta superfamily [Dactylococcopsis salina PCC 8305]
MNQINVDLGRQRDWVWRGWQVRYTYLRAKRETGKNPPLVLLHGFGAAIGHWRHNLPILSETHTAYAIDWLGFGASRKAVTRYSMDFWSDQLYHFWRTVINSPAIFIGNSLGSLIGLTAASRYPEMAQGLILINLPDTAARSEILPPTVQKLVNGVESLFSAPWLLRGLFPILRSRSVIRRWAKLAYPNVPNLDEELVTILCTPPRDQCASDAFVALVKSALNPHFAPPVKQLLPHLTIPILLLWGERDRFIPPQLARSFVDLNPNLELVMLPKLGHCPHDESPQQFHRVILPWLEKYQFLSQ